MVLAGLVHRFRPPPIRPENPVGGGKRLAGSEKLVKRCLVPPRKRPLQRVAVGSDEAPLASHRCEQNRQVLKAEIDGVVGKLLYGEESMCDGAHFSPPRGPRRREDRIQAASSSASNRT